MRLLLKQQTSEASILQNTKPAPHPEGSGTSRRFAPSRMPTPGTSSSRGPIRFRGATLAYVAGIIALVSGCSSPGKHEFALGIYSVPKAALPDVRAAGFNLVTGPADHRFLDAAQRAHLRVLASPGTSAGKNFSADRARAAVKELDAHPALWAWYLVDEPDLNGVSPGEVRQANGFLKNAGAKKPTALVLYQGGEALDYGSLADITMIDRYPVPWLPLANFPQHVRMARLAVGQKRPLIAVIQAFDWECYPKLMPKKSEFRPPTYEELRCMTYCALARQANGIFYYCYDDGKWRMMERPETWTALKRVTTEVRQRMPLFGARRVWWPYVHEYDDTMAGFSETLESSIIPTLLQVDKGNVAVPRGLYLLAVNSTDRTLHYRITLPDKTTSERVPVVGEARTIALQDNWAEDNFGPFDVHIYGPIRTK